MKTSAIITVLTLAALGSGQAAEPAQQPVAEPAQQQAQQPAQPKVRLIGRKASSANRPTPSDMYCGGFIASQKISSHRYVTAGWNSPDQTRYASQSVDTLYIHGRDMKEGDRFAIIRPAKDPNHYEYYPGQNSAVSSLGQPYFEMGYVRVIDVQREIAVAVPELACADFVVGDIAVPFEERQAPAFKVVSLDKFAPPSGRTQGRIVMGHEFDGYLASKSTAVINMGENKGIKVGDYLRVTRTYSRTYRDPEAKLAMNATVNEDTQADAYKRSDTEVSSLPLRTLGDMIVVEVRKKSATAMVVTSFQEIQVGDGVELMDTSNAPEEVALQPTFTAQPTATTAPSGNTPAATTADNLPQISCSASPMTVHPGDTSTITCDASSPDNRPVSITFVTNAGKLSSSHNQAKLDTTDVAPGPVAVRATAFDDRQLSASSTTTINVEALPVPQAGPQKMTDLDFKPGSAYVDNRSKAILDDVALKMQQDPTSSAVVIGSADEKESPTLASRRAENTKTYLTASKGIDPQRIQTRSGKTPGRGVQIWTLPAGATLPQ